MSIEDEDKGGEVVFAGYASWSMVGKNNKTADFDGVEDQILWGFHRLKPLMGIKITKVISGNRSCTCIALGADGKAYTWGRNKWGQLGLGHNVNTYNPTLVDMKDEVIIGGACGSNHTLLFSKEGSLFAAGNGKCGQLGIGRKVDSVKTFSPVNMNGASVKAVACGREFSMIVDTNGVIYSCGHPEYGCLGNGSEGKTLERSKQYTYDYVTSPAPIVDLAKSYGDVKITDVACGVKHTCAMDTEGRIYTWGFGAYGRLGHKDNVDHYTPHAVELFSMEPPPLRDDVPKFMQQQIPKLRASKITCGGTCTYVVAGEPHNALYMFGITKRTGEAFMYPVMVDNVSGWKVRSVAAGNTSTIVSSERTLITWGASPTYGELGYGEDQIKSSTVSKKVDALEGAFTLQVAMGTAHSLAIVDVEDPKSKQVLESLPVFAPEEVDPDVAKNAGQHAVEERRAKRSKKAKEAEDDDDEEEDEKASFDDGDDDDNDDDEEEGYEEDEEPGNKRKR